MRPGLWQIILVVVLIFILFGSNKIPDMMRNLAGGINVFKKELKDDKKEETPVAKTVKSKSAPKKASAKKTPVKKAVAKKATVKKVPAKKTAKK